MATGTFASVAKRATAAFIASVHSTVAKLDTLTWDMSSLGSNFADPGGNDTAPSFSGGNLRFAGLNGTTHTYGQAQGVAAWDLTSSYGSVQVVQASLESNTPVYFGILDAATEIFGPQVIIVWDGSVVRAYATDPVGGDLANRVHTDGDFYRFRESAGIVYVEYGTTGLSWSTLASYVSSDFAGVLDPTYVFPYVAAGCFSATTPDQTIIFDNFNLSTGATGTVASTAQRAVSALTGAQTQTGTVASTAQRAVAALTGTQAQTGTFASAAQRAIAALSGAQSQTGSIVATAQRAVADLTGSHSLPEAMASISQRAISSFTGTQSQQGTLAGVAQPAKSSLTGTQTLSGSFSGVTLRPSGVFVSAQVSTGIFASLAQPANLLILSFAGIVTPAPPRMPPFESSSQPASEIVSPRQVVVIRTSDGIQLYQFIANAQTRITWGRESREVSRCEVQVASLIEHGRMPDILPWAHWVDVWDESGQIRYWTGPIQRMETDRLSMSLSSRDIGSFFTRTRSPLDKRWDAIDPAYIAEELVVAMTRLHNLPFALDVRPDPLGDRFDFTATEGDKMLDQVMRELVDLGLHWTVTPDGFLLGPMPLRAVASLSEDDFVGGGIALVRDGTESYNDLKVRGADAEVVVSTPMAGQRLQTIVDINDMFSVTNLDRAALQQVRYSGRIMDMITVPSGAVLHPEAPVVIDQLIPSARVTVESYGVLTTMELTRVEVNCSADTTAVAVSLVSVDDDLPELEKLQQKTATTVGSGL